MILTLSCNRLVTIYVTLSEHQKQSSFICWHKLMFTFFLCFQQQEPWGVWRYQETGQPGFCKAVVSVSITFCRIISSKQVITQQDPLKLALFTVNQFCIMQEAIIFLLTSVLKVWVYSGESLIVLNCPINISIYIM